MSDWERIINTSAEACATRSFDKFRMTILYIYFKAVDYKIKYYSLNPSPVRTSGTVSLRGKERVLIVRERDE